MKMTVALIEEKERIKKQIAQFESEILFCKSLRSTDNTIDVITLKKKIQVLQEMEELLKKYQEYTLKEIEII